MHRPFLPNQSTTLSLSEALRISDADNERLREENQRLGREVERLKVGIG